jgi:hypothetical protein
MTRPRRPRQIAGRFCERQVTPKSAFDRRSFRWKKSGKAWVLIGCPKGKWTASTERCRVGTRAHVVLKRTGRMTRCKRGEKRIVK